jgi:hypothetical protein
MPRQALGKARQKHRVQVREGEPERPQNGWVDQVEHLPGSGAGDYHAATRGRRGGTEHGAGKFGPRLGLPDRRQVLVQIVARDDLGPGAAETRIHLIRRMWWRRADSNCGPTDYETVALAS